VGNAHSTSDISTSIGILSMTSFQLLTQKTFQVEGEFLGFIDDFKDEAKYFRLAVGEQELEIKLDKELRRNKNLQLFPGDRLQVLGIEKFKKDSGKVKLKALQVIQLSCNLEKNTSYIEESVNQQKAQILICQGSGCLKKGTRSLYSELEEAINTLGWQERVELKTTGCQKCCKHAPNMTLILGKIRFSHSSPYPIFSLVKKHLFS
jgi:hypothetical protein